MADIADMNLLESILIEITGKEDTLRKYSNNLGDLIREAEYHLS